MGNQWLAVSNPPHGEVDPKHAARCLGLTPAEAGMKVNFRAPEVWLAGSDQEKMEQVVGKMKDGEISVALLAGEALSSVPAQQAATAFTFDETKFTATVDGSDVSINYDASITGVFIQPPKEQAGVGRKLASMADRMGKGSSSAMFGSSASSSSLTDALEEATFLDLYVANGQATQRLSIAQDLVDFAGLGDAKPTGAAKNMTRFVSECEQRFSRLHLDDRLVGVRARRRVMVGGPDVPHEGRKLYSFGTLALSKLLESISPELGKLTQSELGSRVAFLMKE